MQINALSDKARATILSNQTSKLKQSAQIAGQELASGLAMDVAQKQRGNLMPLVAVEGSLRKLEGFGLATTNAAIATNRTQQILTGFEAMTVDLIPGLINTLTTGLTNVLDATLKDATDRLGSVLSGLNSRVGERSLFAGLQTDRSAVADTATILTALRMAITTAGATSALDIEAAIDDWFASPAGFETVGYLGGGELPPSRLSPDDDVQVGVTANDPALRDLIKGLSMAALAGTLSVAPDALTRVTLAQRSGELLLQNQSDRAVLAARVGISEARIDATSIRNASEKASLERAQSDLRSVDPYEAAVRMESAQTQLESLYAVTARLSRLSLLDFLR
jgi:flagellar hook-associated protein 3 FlgL